MAEGYEPQPSGITPIYLGAVSDLNISNRQMGKIYIMIYTQETSNIPAQFTGGFSFLFVNIDSPGYGRQFAISNSGFYTRSLAAGNYSAWSTIQ